MKAFFTARVAQLKSWYTGLTPRGRANARNFGLAGLFIVAIFALAHCSSAKAESVATPLQTAHDGLWADALQVGKGFDVRTYDGFNGDKRAFVLFYAAPAAGSDSTAQPWYWADVAFGDVNTATTLYRSDTHLGDSVASPFVPVGTISLQAAPSDCATLDALVTFDPQPGATAGAYSFSLSPLIQPFASSCYACTVPDVSPPAPGCSGLYRR